MFHNNTKTLIKLAHIVKDVIKICLLFLFLASFSSSVLAYNTVTKVIAKTSTKKEHLIFYFKKKISYSIVADKSSNIKKITIYFKENTKISPSIKINSLKSKGVSKVNYSTGKKAKIILRTKRLNGLVYYSEKRGSYYILALSWNRKFIARSQKKIKAKVKVSKSSISKNTPVSVKSSKNKRDIVIIVDAGHGGKDMGATRLYRGKIVREKNIVLSIAKKIANKINSIDGFKAYLTRKNDRFVTLWQRTKITREKKADFFLSIHANSLPKRTPTIKKRAISGAMVFVLSLKGASNTMNKWISNIENRSEIIAGSGTIDLHNSNPDIRKIFIGMSTNATIEESLKAGKEVINKLTKVKKTFSNKVEHAGFAVLKALDVASLLIEVGFLTNNSDIEFIQSASNQNKIAKAITDGIVKHFYNHPIINTKIYEKTR